jgi:hypothetical protein
MKTHTERHFDDIRYGFDTHESECNDCDDGNSGPAEFLHQGKREGKQIEGDTLLEMNAICSAG